MKSPIWKGVTEQLRRDEVLLSAFAHYSVARKKLPNTGLIRLDIQIIILNDFKGIIVISNSTHWH